MSGLSSINLLVAALDLKMIKLIRQAMRTADLSSGRPAAVVSIGPAPNAPRTVHPEVRFTPRPVMHPTPRFEPRRVFHPEPRIELSIPLQPDLPHHAKGSDSPIQPPWRVLPWDTPLPPTLKIKVLVRKSDEGKRGTLLDAYL